MTTSNEAYNSQCCAIFKSKTLILVLGISWLSFDSSLVIMVRNHPVNVKGQQFYFRFICTALEAEELKF